MPGLFSHARHEWLSAPLRTLTGGVRTDGTLTGGVRTDGVRVIKQSSDAHSGVDVGLGVLCNILSLPPGTILVNPNSSGQRPS